MQAHGTAARTRRAGFCGCCGRWTGRRRGRAGTAAGRRRESTPSPGAGRRRSLPPGGGGRPLWCGASRRRPGRGDRRRRPCSGWRPRRSDQRGWNRAASRKPNGCKWICAVRRPNNGLALPSTSRSMNPRYEPHSSSTTLPAFFHSRSQQCCNVDRRPELAAAIHWNSSRARTSFEPGCVAVHCPATVSRACRQSPGRRSASSGMSSARPASARNSRTCKPAGDCCPR